MTKIKSNIKTKSVNAKKPQVKVNRATKKQLLDKNLKFESSKNLFFTSAIQVLTILIVLFAVFGYIYYQKNRPEAMPSSLNSDKIVLPQSSGDKSVQSEAGQESKNMDLNKKVVEYKEVEITKTSTGFLNVRTGPGTSYQIVKKINPGDRYPVISEDKQTGWYQIQLDASTDGWIIKTYAKIVE